MGFDRTALRSKVARRIFTLFVSCALVPISCLTVLSYILVTRQLSEQSRQRLYQAGKASGMGIVERLQILDSNLEMVASMARFDEEIRLDDVGMDLQRFFAGLNLHHPTGNVKSLLGSGDGPSELTTPEREHLASGQALLSIQHELDSSPRFFLTRAVDPGNSSQGTLVGEINPNFLWGSETLPAMAELLVVDSSERVLFSSLPPGEAFSLEASSVPNHVTLRHGADEYMATSWSIPLKFLFFASEWTVVLGESRQSVLAPLKNFKVVFPLVILLSLWLVLLFSISQIRRNLIPLENLQEGTKRIAERDFNSRVRVDSGDEFEELAGAFNNMASQLGRQFNALATMAEIDRAILATLNTGEIVDTVLARTPEIIHCDCVSVTLPGTNGTGKARTYLSHNGSKGGATNHYYPLHPAEVDTLNENWEGSLVWSKDFPAFLTPFVERDVDSAWVLPIFLEANLSAVIALGYRRPDVPNEEDKAQISQLAGRVAVALANARLLEDLDRLNWGALVALARTIDAKSPWTLGHCERAAEMAVKIGKTMGLGAKQLEDIHRGALLHDIGKIAIPPSILDKTGKLTDEERLIMQEHPRKGARILEPIEAYKSVIPVVAQHHEWWDGNGYPYKIAGENIELSARIYAVADVYDAMASDRPYRAGLTRQEVVKHIKGLSGRQFDPKVVEAFLEMMEKEKEEPAKKTLYASPLLTS